jgi:hypothetical protein
MSTLERIEEPNQPAPVNAPVARWFQIGHPRRRVTEQRRWAKA